MSPPLMAPPPDALPPLTISPVRSPRDRRDWLDLPGAVQGRDPFWVAPLRMEQKRLLDRSKNPFFRRGDAEFFLARRGERCLGRISAHTALPMAGLSASDLGTFGFFECADDPAAAAQLLRAAESWLSARGARTVMGPMNFSLNAECGVLVDGYDSPPFLLMNHNPPYYGPLLESGGYRKRKDLYAWRYTVGEMPVELLRLAERVKKRSGLTLRPLDRAHFDRDARAVLRLFNDAWKDNWGFTPMHPDEFDEAIRELKQIVDPELVLIAEKDGREVAIAVSVPNLNEALAGLDGRLFPFGVFKLLWRLKVKGTRTARCLMLGIDKGARGFATLGLSALLYVAMNEAGRKRGVEWGELSWTLEDNDAINQGIAATGAVRYKTYRVYEKVIAA